MMPHIELDRGRHAAPQLYELLRTQIVSLQLLPGAPLSRVSLSAEFNVSQTPVREALLRLTAERLVDVFPQAATRVSLIDVAFAQETHYLRRALELEIVRDLALSRPPKVIAQLQAILSRQESLRDNQDLAGFSEADQTFHRCMYQALDKDDLWVLVHSRSGHIDRLRRLHLPANGKLNRIISDHSQILAAIEDGNPAEAQNCLRLHLSGTLEYVEKIQQAHPQYFTGRLR